MQNAVSVVFDKVPDGVTQISQAEVVTQYFFNSSDNKRALHAVKGSRPQ